MKPTLKGLQDVLVHIYEYVVEGKKRTAVLVEIDALNGVILEETFEGSGLLRGISVSGGTVYIPIEGITNYFQSWWKVFTDDGRGGQQSIYTDDEERVGNQAANDVGKAHRWDENGEYKRAKEVEHPPADAKRIVPADKRPEKYR